ncbi:MAG: hypothetical protein SVM80_07460 [Halobacteriota archaeon]|nr:hypothetical protein [Halobacteriota archaeon]
MGTENGYDQYMRPFTVYIPINLEDGLHTLTIEPDIPTNCPAPIITQIAATSVDESTVAVITEAMLIATNVNCH